MCYGKKKWESDTSEICTANYHPHSNMQDKTWNWLESSVKL